MRNLLLKYKIIELFELKLDMTKGEFEDKLNALVQSGSVGVFNSFSEVFSRDKKEFIGEVTGAQFHIKLKRRLLVYNRGIATAKGATRQHNNKLIVETEINGLPGAMRILVIALSVFYAFAIIAIVILAFSLAGIGILWAFIGVLAHMVFMYGIIYFVARSGAKKLKSELVAALK